MGSNLAFCSRRWSISPFDLLFGNLGLLFGDFETFIILGNDVGHDFERCPEPKWLAELGLEVADLGVTERVELSGLQGVVHGLVQQVANGLVENIRVEAGADDVSRNLPFAETGKLHRLPELGTTPFSNSSFKSSAGSSISRCRSAEPSSA